jgi:putative spermidine/putrescine transport system ATP-binding protein
MNRISGVAREGHLQVATGILPMADLPLNQPASAMFRPEDVEIVTAGESGAELFGDVMSTFFMGDRTRLMVDVGAELPVIVETRRRAAWHAGERIGMRVPSHALMPCLVSAQETRA